MINKIGGDGYGVMLVRSCCLQAIAGIEPQ